MLLNIESSGKHHLKDLLSQGRVVQHYIDKAIEEDHEEREWDGYIHPSHLNWAVDPKKQFESHVKKGSFRPPIEAKRRFFLGNIYHDQIQMLMERNFPGFREVRFADDKIMFHGTCDYVGLHRKLGCVVFEFKSYAEHETDNTWASSFVEKFERLLCTSGLEREGVYRSGIDGRIETLKIADKFHLFTDKQLQELYHRVRTRQKILLEPAQDHLTQGFTYAWRLAVKRGGLVQQFSKSGKALKDGEGNNVWDWVDLPEPDRVCVCYFGKSGLETKEFWYPLQKKKGSQYMQKAIDNYKAVYKELRRYERSYA